MGSVPYKFGFGQNGIRKRKKKKCWAVCKAKNVKLIIITSHRLYVQHVMNSIELLANLANFEERKHGMGVRLLRGSDDAN